MKTASEWFREYSQTHRHPVNRLIHKFCVPLIYWSAIGILWALPRPWAMSQWVFLNWATIALIGALIFYWTLGLTYFVEMFVFSMICVASVMYIEIRNGPLLWIAAGVFTVAWVG